MIPQYANTAMTEIAWMPTWPGLPVKSPSADPFTAASAKTPVKIAPVTPLKP